MPFIFRNRAPAGGNALYSTLEDAEHRWEFKDFTTNDFEDIDFIDDGTSVSPVNLAGSATVSMATNVPGATRGSPYEPSVSSPGGLGGFINTNAAVVNHIANSTTGTWGMWVKPIADMATFSANNYTMMMQRWLSNSGLSMGWGIRPDGAVIAWMDSNANQVLYVGTAGDVTPGVWNFIAIDQPGDGGGFDLYIDGVAQTFTPTIGGTGSLDDWADRLYADWGAPSQYYLKTSFANVGLGALLPCEIFSPFVFESSAGNILIGDIQDAVNLDGVTEDVREWIATNILLDNHWSFSYVNSSDALAAHGQNAPLMQASSTPALVTGPWADTAINHYHNGAADFGGSDTFFPNGNPSLDYLTSLTVGSWGAWVRTPSVLTTRRCFLSAGASSISMVEVGMNASGKFYGILQKSSGNSYELVATGITLTADTWYFVSYTHDGVNPHLYIDGAEVTGGDLTTTALGTGVAADWHNDLPGWANDGTIRISGAAGSSSVRNWDDGRIGDFFIHNTALTAQQISDMHNAANGVFA